MATYSAFFSSGLLAPRVAACGTMPILSSSPMGISAGPGDPVDRQFSLTPTPAGQTNPRSKAPEAHTHAERPVIRRRRSSINIGTSPMALIKSPARNAGAAFQRTGFMSPTRHRAGSVGMSDALQNNSLVGRLRSGSVGGIANPPKRLRRAICRPVPLAPPPSAPLPAVPPRSPTPTRGSSPLPPAILGPTPQQSATSRSSRVDNAGIFFSQTSSSTPMSLGYTAKPFKLLPRLSGSHGGTIDEVMMEC